MAAPGRVVRAVDVDVPAGSGRTDLRRTGYPGLWAAVGPDAMDMRYADRAAPAAGSIYPTTEGLVSRGQPDAAHHTAGPGGVRTDGSTDSRGVRATPKNATRIATRPGRRGAAGPG